jgi:hypothetical protein
VRCRSAHRRLLLKTRVRGRVRARRQLRCSSAHRLRPSWPCNCLRNSWCYTHKHTHTHVYTINTHTHIHTYIV